MKRLLVFWSLVFFAARAAATVPGRVWGVSLTPLPSVPAAQQFRSIGEAAKFVRPGDTVMIHSGVYRESVTVSASGTTSLPIRFEAAPDAKVVVTGTDLVTGWQKEPGPDNIFSAAWPYSFLGYSHAHAHPDDDYDLLIGRVEQVFVENYPLHQVLRRDQLSRGTFFVDLDAKRLYAWSAGNQDLNSIPVEASTRDVLWHCAGDYVETRGLRFRDAASAAQQGAADFGGQGDVIRDCVFERASGQGADFHAPAQLVQDCIFRDNGQMGFSASGYTTEGAPGIRITGCLLQNNNTKGFSRDWEAGGSKVCFVRRMVIDHCRVLDNHGPGLWFDIGCDGCEVKNCLIEDNEDAGLFYEISYGLYAHDNVILGNGLFDRPGAWGAQAGICLSSSPGCTVERNLLIANREGFDFREQERTTPRIGAPKDSKEVAVWNHDETIRHNVLADNRDAQVWGWFDVLDERHWPRAMQTTGTLENPAGRCLETLSIVFAGNLYDNSDGQGLFHWGTAWGRHKYYDDLAAVHRELGLEQGSVVAPLRFADSLTDDFRLPPGSPALKMDCCPHGTVPGVEVGTQTVQASSTATSAVRAKAIANSTK